MNEFNKYLKELSEVGFVDQVFHSIVYVSGIPTAVPGEVVYFENGYMGQVLSLTSDYAEVLLLKKANVIVGERVARTGKLLHVPVGDGLLGKAVNPLSAPLHGVRSVRGLTEMRPIDSNPPPLSVRKEISEPLETGVSLVDLITPLAKGQRELIIGDRKTGKTIFILKTLTNQARKGVICIYCGVAKSKSDILKVEDFVKRKGVADHTIVVASYPHDPSGLIYITPYTAMTYAEYFRDKGNDVLLILDDLTKHAKYYREITLLAKRFPGRNSYPGDIFYIHAKLLERAGQFKDSAITCLPVAESLLRDISGYIQTNLMAMTDGHLFFDVELFNQGRRPSVNTFLSVTRVGHKAQSHLMQDLSRELSAYMVRYESMKQFVRFGAGLGENVRKVLDTGDRISHFLDQSPEQITPTAPGAAVIALIWSGQWENIDMDLMKRQMDAITQSYIENEGYRQGIDALLSTSKSFVKLVEKVKGNEQLMQPMMNVS